MENVVKAFLGLFFTVIIVFLGVTLIAASIDSRKAENFLESKCMEMKSSNYSTAIVNESKNEAIENDYELEVEIYGKKPNQYGRCKLKYISTNPILKFKNENNLIKDIE